MKKKRSVFILFSLSMIFIFLISLNFISADGWVTIFDISTTNNRICNKFVTAWSASGPVYDDTFIRLNNDTSTGLSCPGGVVQATTNCTDGIKLCSNAGQFPVFQVRYEKLIPSKQVRFSIETKFSNLKCCSSNSVILGNNGETVLSSTGALDCDNCNSQNVGSILSFLDSKHACYRNPPSCTNNTCNCPSGNCAFNSMISIDDAFSYDISEGYGTENVWNTITAERNERTYSISLLGKPTISDSLTSISPNLPYKWYIGQTPTILNKPASFCSSGYSSMNIRRVKFECYNSTEICDGWDNDCDNEIDENNICCAGKQCGNDALGRSCGSCSAGYNCVNYQCVPIAPPDAQIISVFWINESKNIVTNAFLDDRVNLTVIGSQLNSSSRIMNYTIYQIGVGSVFVFSKNAYNSTYDTLSWIANTTGNFSFSIQVINGNAQSLSSNLSVNPYPTKSVLCTGILPGNASWNSLDGTGNYTQIWNKTSWNPTQKNASFSEIIGECNFKCSTGYSWSAINKTCNPIITIPATHYCYEMENETACSGAPFSYAVNELRDIHGIENCYTYTNCLQEPRNINYSIKSCYCSWNNDLGECSSAQEIEIINNCSIAPSCSGSTGECAMTSVAEDSCDSPSGSLKIKVASSWTGNALCRPGWCVDAEETYPCTSTEKLPFFSFSSFIVCFALIIVFYSVFFKRFF